MEYKFQDILKNIIPGFYIVLGMVLLCWLSGCITNLDLIDVIKNIPSEVFIFFIPLIFYILGYLNDILSSCFEFYLYELGCKRPSELLLNNKKKRYRLPKLEKIKNELGLPNENILSREESYRAFQKANEMKDIDKDNITEFYVSYIFARNFMVANFLLVIGSFIVAVFNTSNCHIWIILISYSLLSFLFVYRWKQKALYYSKKVFNSIIK
ncbi:hypothetical protein [uncultured Proteiniphilum sp.]|uniref:hypothetical protein n=1 Tax=uncultured Proteiniphilum sp. TaxID=497637 RepID=UPI00261F2393|nr:hypothetical protein [uncultured Proteiniphilum sp.]